MSLGALDSLPAAPAEQVAELRERSASAEQMLWRDLVIARRKVERALEQRLQRDANISVADFEILTTLCRAPEQKLRARDLGEVLGWEKSRLSHQVSRMEARGLVERQNCPTDLRGTWVVITEPGHDAAALGIDGHAETLRLHFGVLDSDEQKNLTTSVERIIRSTDPAACAVADEVFGA